MGGPAVGGSEFPQDECSGESRPLETQLSSEVSSDFQDSGLNICSKRAGACSWLEATPDWLALKRAITYLLRHHKWNLLSFLDSSINKYVSPSTCQVFNPESGECSGTQSQVPAHPHTLKIVRDPDPAGPNPIEQDPDLAGPTSVKPHQRIMSLAGTGR
ncbi:hypothetical protein MDA_GLEAN10000916 [Myotis davidii]|uniref:Uncharacterized protein n=1 Tax=Myotis davidii TaxID=225400 RepID=L5MEA9_MYODS|nr:hypothetical protein MDA_GLEAN10000916 [Myotis davidii]